MNWHDTPPTKAGTYWVKTPLCDEEPIHLAPDGSWWYADHPKARANVGGCQFGNRIPTNDELAALPGLVELYACKRMNQAEAEATDEWGDRATFENQAAEYKAKINAILGVADESGAD